MSCEPNAMRTEDTLTQTASRAFRIGETLFEAGAPGSPWRVVSGSVRLDRANGSDSGFASLALRGDVIGAETLLFGRYTFTARALSDCTIEPWLEPGTQPGGETLLLALTSSERRAAEVVALRCGQAIDRVKRLLLLLAHEDPKGYRPPRVLLPELRDIADITNLAVETVSRALSRLSSQGLLQKHGWRRAELIPEFVRGARDVT